MNKPRSASFFHFTKDINSLKKILKTKCFYPNYCLEDVTWYKFKEKVAYPMVCFCDIPLSRIDAHIKDYSSVGIGLSKKWGLKKNLNPIVYCPKGSLIIKVAKFLDEQINWQEKEKSNQKEIIRQFLRLAKLIKPLKGTIQIKSRRKNRTIENKDFYQESEWRYTPEELITQYISGDDNEFAAKLDEYNSKAKEYKLEFAPEDVKYIFVPKEDDIPDIANCISEEFDQSNKNQSQILISKIISLDTIRSDL